MEYESNDEENLNVIQEGEGEGENEGEDSESEEEVYISKNKVNMI